MKENYLNLPNKVLSRAYELLTGETGYPEEYKADEMKSILNDELRIAKPIMMYKSCIDYMDKFITESNPLQNGEMPNNFIYDSGLYRKEFDGLFHIYPVGTEHNKENSVDTCSVGEAERILTTSKFKKEIFFCTNDTLKKL